MDPRVSFLRHPIAPPSIDHEADPSELRASGLKRRLEDLLAAADAATAELEASKRAGEVAAEELSASQAQAAIAAKSIRALEATVSHLQEEISTVGSELEALKSKEDSERDEFLSQMYEMNPRIRQFQRMVSQESAEYCSVQPAADGHHVSDQNGMIDLEAILKDLSEKVSNTDAEALDGEYKKDLLDLEKLRQELADTQSRRPLMDSEVPVYMQSSIDNLKRQKSTPRDHCQTPPRLSIISAKDWCGGSLGCRLSTCSHGLTSPGSSSSDSSFHSPHGYNLSAPLSPLDSFSSSPVPLSPINSVLPPLPDLGTPWLHTNKNSGKIVDDEVSCKSSSTSGSSSVDATENFYSFEGPACEELVAPFRRLALEEEELDLLADAAIELGSDRKALEFIQLFDESGHPGTKAPTCRDFLLRLPAVFLFKEQRTMVCSVCELGYSPTSRAVRLPCNHYYHIKCVLAWLLRSSTCPMCRLALPRAED